VRVMVSLAQDLKLALDRVAFAQKAGLVPIRGSEISSAPRRIGCSSTAVGKAASPP
jgi:hypothetical protein